MPRIVRAPVCSSILLIAGLGLAACAALAAEPVRVHKRIDPAWRFHRGDVAGAQSPDFDDTAWRAVDLPHDWSIEDLPAVDISDAPQPAGEGAAVVPRVVRGPFDSAAPGAGDTGFTVGGTGWYRKHFTAPDAWRGRVVTIEFEGVYMGAEVWINGRHLGGHRYGHTGFAFDLSPHLCFGGADNVLVVQANNLGHNARWYTGSGINRHVWLTVTSPTHIARSQPIVTTPRVAPDAANVRVHASIDGAGDAAQDFRCEVRIVDAAGVCMATGETAISRVGEWPGFDTTLTVTRPQLWSPESPTLYTAVCELARGDTVIDRTETVFGIRSIRFDPEHGFFLNDKHVLLKGGCVHENNGPLGSAAFDRAEERKVELLKAAGFNAVRSAHNPRPPGFLEACDRLGMMVIEEAFDMWEVGKLPDDYHNDFAACWRDDLTAMVEAGRNHPCVILWSIGSEIREASQESGARLAHELGDFVRALDDTRPVTANVNRMGKDWLLFDPYFEALDVGGYSYAKAFYESDHARLPKRAILATETGPRQIFDYWMKVEDLDYVAGDFVWTAIDYMGESGLGWWSYGKPVSTIWPWNVSYSGDFDICGGRRPRSYYRDILWKNGSRVAAFVHAPEPSFPGGVSSLWGWDDVTDNWTWPGHEGEDIQVDAYSRCERVQLVLNGRDLGTQPTSRDSKFIASWKIPYEPGTLTAIGYDGGVEVARWTLQTAGEPAALRLSVDRPSIRADGQDLCFVSVEVIDAHGQRVPRAERLVHFELEGCGSLAAVASARPNSLESFRQPQRTTFDGRALAIVRAGSQPSTCKLHVSCDGLGSAEVGIDMVTP